MAFGTHKSKTNKFLVRWTTLLTEFDIIGDNFLPGQEGGGEVYSAGIRDRLDGVRQQVVAQHSLHAHTALVPPRLLARNIICCFAHNEGKMFASKKGIKEPSQRYKRNNGLLIKRFNEQKGVQQTECLCACACTWVAYIRHTLLGKMLAVHRSEQKIRLGDLALRVGTVQHALHHLRAVRDVGAGKRDPAALRPVAQVVQQVVYCRRAMIIVLLCI